METTPKTIDLQDRFDRLIQGVSYVCVLLENALNQAKRDFPNNQFHVDAEPEAVRLDYAHGTQFFRLTAQEAFSLGVQLIQAARKQEVRSTLTNVSSTPLPISAPSLLLSVLNKARASK